MVDRIRASCIAFSLFFSLSLLSEEVAPSASLADGDKTSPIQGYTINYNTVSIIEYIRFASKICNTNFIFNEEDLDFTVTVVSDAPITSQNVMATLLQLLRIHGLSLLEQENNLVIHKSPAVTQIATIVTDKNQATNAPIVTRIFRLKDVRVDPIAGIIRPMISSSALLEVLPETKQIILTDVTANVDKVSSLIEILDSPANQLGIKTYTTVNNSPEPLVELASQIMTPMTQGNPYLLVSQPFSGTIFIVSTNDLIERTVSVLTSLDVPPNKAILAQRKLKGENIFVYKAVNQSGEELLKALGTIADNLKKSGIPEGDLIDTIQAAQSLKETNSITFVGSKDAIAKIKEFLTTLDAPGKEGALLKSPFFIYRPKNRSAKEIETSLREMADNLKGAKGGAEEKLVQVIYNAKINHTTNTILFLGDETQFIRIKDLLTEVDIPIGKGASAAKHDFLLYKIQYISYEDLHDFLKSFAKNLEKSNVQDQGLIQVIESMLPIAETQSALFSGADASLKRLQELLPSFDTTTIPVSNQFLVYKPKYQKADLLEKSLHEVTSDLKLEQFRDPALLRAIESMKLVKNTGSFLFTGDAASLKRVDELMGMIDAPASAKIAPKVIWIYAPQYTSREKSESYFKQLASSLNKEGESDLIETIQSMKWIDSSHSFLFQGTDSSINRLKDLVKTFDIPANASASKNFILYPLQHTQPAKTNQYLDQLGNNLSKEGNEKELVETIRSRKWIEDSHSFMFQGTQASLTRLQELLQGFDVPANSAQLKKFFLYSLKNTSEKKANQYLDKLTSSLSKDGNEKDLVETIQSRKWIDDSHSFLFQGHQTALDRIQELMTTFDTPESKVVKPEYYIYKLQHVSGDTMEEELDNLAKDLKASGTGDEKILSVIHNIRHVKKTNSLLLTGDPTAIERVKEMIAEYDHPREISKANTNFFLYKPKHQTPAQIGKSLTDLTASLKKAGLADPFLLQAIESAKYVEATNSIVFTGNAESIQKIQSLLNEIDVPPKEHAPIQHIGKTTFLLYKLKAASGPQIVTSIKTMTSDLKKTGQADPEFVNALDSMKFVKETNSLFFTGTEEALGKVQGLVERFDVSSLAAPTIEKPTVPGQPNYILYKPVAVPPKDLEKLVSDFAENVRASGLNDPDLFATLSSMRLIDSTQSLVFTGTTKSLDQVKELLQSFDIPSHAPPKPVSAALEPTIHGVDNTSFLVYKLQFHKGDEIQSALKQIAKDLLNTNAPINQNLLNAINSIQWLDITNSLLCTGDQETLSRLKELVKNLDLPLKQVFIEILVIETTLSNALLFGLEWGGNYKFNDKFGISSFNSAGPPDTFVNQLSNLTPPSPPTPIGNIPPGVGFDLGVIGEVIKHNGNTFLTIGSLLNALQMNTETTIITAPKILGQDGHTSTIFSGSNIPFTGSFVNNTTQGATVLTSNIEYRDIGLNLTITPVLGQSSDIVTLDINLDRSQTVNDITGQSQLNFQSQTANGIITSKTTMSTTVHVPDRNFLVLSGFVNNTNTKMKQGIPCLGGLPMIGAAFSKQNDTISNQNVVIFLRPCIINSIDDMRRVTSEQEVFFRDLSNTPFLEHNYDDSIEMIKSIDDE